MPATDRLDLLRLFIRVAEIGSVSEAARAVGLSQPSASRALKLLEEEARAKLVARSTHALSLTPAGRMLLERARRLLLDWDAAMEAAQAERQTIAGRIRVIAPVAVGQSYLARIASRFQLAHPSVVLEWELRDGPVDLIAADCDVWIHVGEATSDDLVCRRIYEIRRVVVASPAWPGAASPEELLARPAVRLSTYVPASVRLARSNEAFVLRQKAVFTTGNLYAAHVAALEGVGYAVLPLWLVQSDVRRGALHILCPEWLPPSIELSLAYLPSSRSARVRALVDFMEAELTRSDGLGITFLREFDALDAVSMAGSS